MHVNINIKYRDICFNTQTHSSEISGYLHEYTLTPKLPYTQYNGIKKKSIRTENNLDFRREKCTSGVNGPWGWVCKPPPSRKNAAT